MTVKSRIFVILGAILLVICSVGLMTACQNNDGYQDLKGEGAVSYKTNELDGGKAYKFILRNIETKNNVIKINIIPGDKSEITVSAENNILATFDVAVTDEEVKVLGSEEFRYVSDNLSVSITVPVYDIEVAGAYELKYKNENLTDVKFVLNGAGDADIDAGYVENFNIVINGAGDIVASGRADKAEYIINGAGKLNAYNLRCGELAVAVNGVGDAGVYAEEKLDAVVQGIGSIVYDGNPKVVNKELGGLATIKKK